MGKIQLMFFFTSLLVIVGCASLEVSSTPLSTTTATAVMTAIPATSTALPTATPTTVVLPSLTPTQVKESQWQCDPGGGLACYADLKTVAMLNEQEGWIFGSTGIVLRYMIIPGDNGPTWQPNSRLPSPYPLEAFSPISAVEGWGIMGRIIRYQGGRWENTQEIEGVELRDITMLNATEGWAVGRDISKPTAHRDGLIYHYTQSEWLKEFTLPYEPLLAIDMVDTEEGWAIGWDNVILHYQNQQWERVDISHRNFIFDDIDMVNKNEGWIVGNGIILHYHNGVWKEESPELIDRLFEPRIHMVSAEEGWIVDSYGYILHYQDGQWQKVDSPTENDLLSISMVSAEEGWAVGRNSTILHYHNGVWELVSEAQ